LDAGFGKAFGEPDRGESRSPIRMVDNIFEIEDTFLLAGPDSLLDRVENHRQVVRESPIASTSKPPRSASAASARNMQSPPKMRRQTMQA
jgi:hypothetical protein